MTTQVMKMSQIKNRILQALEKRIPARLRKYGKKAFWAVFFYYLVRDLILYVAIPIWVASKV